VDTIKKEPVAGIETYADVRKNLLLTRCMLRQLREKRD